VLCSSALSQQLFSLLLLNARSNGCNTVFPPEVTHVAK